MLLLKDLVILFLLIEAAFADENCANDKSQIPSVKLRRDLLCSYDPSIRPVLNHQNATLVTLKIYVKFFSFEELSNKFDLDSFLTITWTDQHLKWTPSDYSDISLIRISTDDIWKPDMSTYNRVSQSGSAALFDSVTCLVHYSGNVVCVPPSRLSSLCVPDLTYFPFDTQNCTVRIGSWVHSGEEINLTAAQVSLSDLVENGQWKLFKVNIVRNPGKFKCCPNETYPWVDFSFEIGRLGGAHTATVVLPAIALAILTLTSLFIDPSSPDRLTLCCLNLICEFLYSQFVTWVIPQHGQNIPLITIFARDSLILSSFAIFFTIFLKKLISNTNMNKQSPAWMSQIVQLTISNKAGQFLFLRDSSLKGVATAKGEEDGDVIIEANTESPNVEESAKNWDIFAKILDLLCLFAYIIVYICMLIAFIP